MECEGTKVQVSALMDANLDIEQVQALEGHLESCSSCAQFYEEQLELARLLKVSEDFQLEPPAAIWQRIDSQISAKPSKFGFLLFPRFDVRYALAACVILVLFGVALLTTLTPSQDDQLLLAELESYTLEVEGNPFLSQMELTDPFLSLPAQAEENPFDKWRSIQ
jgi:predicted anti-sigma-YlaC factor YlaD